MKEIRKTARELMKGFCRVCPVCDGRACAGEVPGMGGLGTGTAFKNNISALTQKTLAMRLIHDILEPELKTSVLGLDLSMPVMAAPIGGISFNMGGQRSEEEYIEAIINGCQESGIIGCTGDGVPPIIHEAGLAAIKAAQGYGIPFIKPWEDEELYIKLAKAQDSGAKIIGMDIDAAGLVTLRKMGRPVGPKTIDKLREIINKSGTKFIVKGVMTVDDAQKAVQAGAHAIVVSNHGGRVLDHTPGTAQVLPAIAQAMQGQVDILVDGGVRTGVDILKMLALGANAVMIGRPFSIAAMGGLTDGVKAFVDNLRIELTQAMVMTGTAKTSDVSLDILEQNI